jgi:hypothetical protein
LLFAQNKITGTIAAKNNKEKMHLQLLLFWCTTKSFVKSTATDEKDTINPSH